MSDIVQKLWGFCHTLRHDGVDYGDYIEQLTYLLFLKMADERGAKVPKDCDWEAPEFLDDVVHVREAVTLSPENLRDSADFGPPISLSFPPFSFVRPVRPSSHVVASGFPESKRFLARS